MGPTFPVLWVLPVAPVPASSPHAAHLSPEGRRFPESLSPGGIKACLAS